MNKEPEIANLIDLLQLNLQIKLEVRASKLYAHLLYDGAKINSDFVFLDDLQKDV